MSFEEEDIKTCEEEEEEEYEDIKTCEEVEELVIKSNHMIIAFEEEVNYMKELLANMKEKINQIKTNQLKANDKTIIYPYPFEENKDEDYEPLKEFPGYEIGKLYPYPIRKVGTKYQLKEFRRGSYIGVCLNKKIYMKHVLVAKQFLPNDDPENKKEVDHKNHNPFDYKIENLEWKTSSENQRNKSGYNGKKFIFVDELPNKIEIKNYGVHTFTNYFYSNHEFYYFTGDKYRQLNKFARKNHKSKYVQLIDNDGKRRKISVSKFESTLK